MQSKNNITAITAAPNATAALRITRSLKLPDPVKIARYSHSPELGPKILFFSGGSALRNLSQHLLHYTHNSIHIITAFDSGGSSAKLRQAFRMIAPGDLRARLMDLADQSVTGNPDIYRLFAFRFPKDGETTVLRTRLQQMIAGDDPLLLPIPRPMRTIIQNHLGYFFENMPDSFDLRGASIGNLVLAGGYLNNRSDLSPVIFLFSKLAEVRGTVLPVVSSYLHLVATLQDGRTIAGQHLMTGKEVPPLSSPIKEVHLARSLNNPRPIEIEPDTAVMRQIREAEVICYPMGSFFSSLVATLLPAGIGQAIANNDCPKVYIPNMGPDPEQRGMTLYQSVKTLLEYLQKSCDKPVPVQRLLHGVIVDSTRGDYPMVIEREKIESLGVQVIDAPLVTADSAPYQDPRLTAEILLSLA